MTLPIIRTIIWWSLVFSSYSKMIINSTPYRTEEGAIDLDGDLVVEMECNVLVCNVNEFENSYSLEMRSCSSTMVAEEEQFVN